MAGFDSTADIKKRAPLEDVDSAYLFDDPGLHAALPTMNPRAVGFLLHTPKDQESEWKEQSVKLLENLGLDRLNRNWNSRLFQFHTNEKILQKVRT